MTITEIERKTYSLFQRKLAYISDIIYNIPFVKNHILTILFQNTYRRCKTSAILRCGHLKNEHDCHGTREAIPSNTFSELCNAKYICLCHFLSTRSFAYEKLNMNLKCLKRACMEHCSQFLKYKRSFIVTQNAK